MSKVSPARRAAFEVLHDVEAEGAMSSILADYDERLSAKDRGLCHEIVLGVLRRQIALDREIDVFAGGKKLDVAVRVILRVGLYQLRHLDRVPAYSAINESVELAKLAKRKSAAGFVNAILRRATRETPQFVFADEFDRINVETSHPRWLLERWVDSFGIERTASIAAANNELPRQFFRPTLNVMVEDIARLNEYKDERFDGVFCYSTPDDGLLEMLSRGAIYTQDAGSQLVASGVSKLIKQRFLDVCASPGGKTGLIAMLQNDRPEIEIVAGDISKNRVDVLRENLSAQGCRDV
nr:transcription antitermination factor NusB [Pyrinomonadaceae bacterium]